jgi:hypothetical protein
MTYTRLQLMRFFTLLAGLPEKPSDFEMMELLNDFIDTPGVDQEQFNQMYRKKFLTACS